MASTSSVTMLASTASSLRGITGMRSERSLRQPALDLVESVHAPERLAVDDDEGRAEYAALDRRVRFALQAFLHRRAGDRREHFFAHDAERRCDVRGHFGAGNIAIVDEVSAISGLGELARERGVAVVEPVKRAS